MLCQLKYTLIYVNSYLPRYRYKYVPLFLCVCVCIYREEEPKTKLTKIPSNFFE